MSLNNFVKNNYQQFLNFMGLKAKTKTAVIPDPKLMIGSAESLAPQSVLIYKDYTNASYNILTKQLNNIDNTKAEYGISDGEFSPDDFVQNTFYIGEPTSASGSY